MDITTRIIDLHTHAIATRTRPQSPHICKPGFCSFSIVDPPHIYICDRDPHNVHICGHSCKYITCDLTEDTATCALTYYVIVQSITTDSPQIPLNQPPPVPRPPPSSKQCYFDRTLHTIINILTHLTTVATRRRSIIISADMRNAVRSQKFLNFFENTIHARILSAKNFDISLHTYRSNIPQIAHAILRLWAIKHDTTKSPAHRRILFFTIIALTAFRAKSFLPVINCLTVIFDSKTPLLNHAATYSHSHTLKTKFASGTITSDTKILEEFFRSCNQERIQHACEPIKHLIASFSPSSTAIPIL